MNVKLVNILTVVLVLMLSGFSILYADDLEVPSQYGTIGAAISAAKSGDHIILSAGVYTGTNNTNLTINDKSITIRSLYPSNPTSVSQTVIDCQGSAQTNVRAFSFSNNQNPIAIEGITIINGFSENGGAISSIDSHLKLTNCIINNCYAADNGGAIAFAGDSVLEVDNCILSENEAVRDGGSVYSNGNSELYFLKSTFSQNSAGRDGGAIAVSDNNTDILISSCYITGNYSYDYGGGINLTAVNKSKIVNTLIAGNATEAYGGGIYYAMSEFIDPVQYSNTIINSTITENRSDWLGGGLRLFRSEVEVANTIIWGNFVDIYGQYLEVAVGGESFLNITSCLIQGVLDDDFDNDFVLCELGSIVERTGINLSSDPDFSSAGVWASDQWSSGNYRPTLLSPCLDGGSMDYIDQIGVEDIEGQARIKGALVDIGAYEIDAPEKLSGDGSESNPYLIEDYSDFQEFISDPSYWAEGVYTRLEADIDLDPALPNRETYSQAPIAGGSEDYEFTGTPYNGDFNGNGHSISGLTIDSSLIVDAEYLGLFGLLESDGVIHDLMVTDVYIAIGDYNHYIGGVCGENFGHIYNCFASGSFMAVSWPDYVGGLCGINNDNGVIEKCYSEVVIECGEEADDIGGLCGANSYLAIIKNCYSFSTISAGDYASNIGGLCGANSYGTIQNCYAVSTVSVGVDSYNIGGLCGGGDNIVINSFWDAQVAGIATGSCGEPKTTTQMKDATTFTGWNDGSWTIDQGNDYPRLSWQQSPGTSITTDYPTATYSGFGTESDPYVITTAYDFVSLSYRVSDWDKYFILANDVDMSTVGNYAGPEYFSGNFDGHDHVIRNLTIDAKAAGDKRIIGLFPWLINANISNLGIVDYNIKLGDNSDSVGALCGFNDFDTISNCYSNGKIISEGIGSWIGGLVGGNYYGNIIDCISECSIICNGDAGPIGGLSGDNYFGTISGSSSSGSITINGESWEIGGFTGGNWEGVIYNCSSSCMINIHGGTYDIGGLCGIADGSSFTGCSSSGSITVSGNGDSEYSCHEIGGFLGSDSGSTINNCMSSGSITCNSYFEFVGGFCGKIAGPDHSDGQSIVSNCFSLANVSINDSGSYIGGFIGHSGGDVSNCYSLGSVSCHDSEDVGGFVGRNGGNGIINNCYSASPVIVDEDCDDFGGFVGYDYSDLISNSFWDIETSGMPDPESGYEDEDGMIGLTTDQMQNINTFLDAGWDFTAETANGTDDIWFMPQNGYPLLAWEPASQQGGNCDIDITGQYWEGWLGSAMSDYSPGSHLRNGTITDTEIILIDTDTSDPDNEQMTYIDRYLDDDGWLNFDFDGEIFQMAANSSLLYAVDREESYWDYLGNTLLIRKPNSPTIESVSGEYAFFGHWIDIMWSDSSAAYGTFNLNSDGTFSYSSQWSDNSTENASGNWNLDSDELFVNVIPTGGNVDEGAQFMLGQGFLQNYDTDPEDEHDLGQILMVKKGSNKTLADLQGIWLSQEYTTNMSTAAPLTAWGISSISADGTVQISMTESDGTPITGTATAQIEPDGDFVISASGYQFNGVLSADNSTFVMSILDRNGEVGINIGVRKLSCPNSADISGDGSVDLDDLAILAQQWLNNDCISTNNCSGADLNHTYSVDLHDFALISAAWLQDN